MTSKWSYLIEADKRFRDAIRRALSSGNPKDYYRVFSKSRGIESSLYDRWDELAEFNRRAGRGFSRGVDAHKFAARAVAKGFYVLLRSHDVNSVATGGVYSTYIFREREDLSIFGTGPGEDRGSIIMSAWRSWKFSQIGDSPTQIPVLAVIPPNVTPNNWRPWGVFRDTFDLRTPPPSVERMPKITSAVRKHLEKVHKTWLETPSNFTLNVLARELQRAGLIAGGPIRTIQIGQIHSAVDHLGFDPPPRHSLKKKS